MHKFTKLATAVLAALPLLATAQKFENLAQTPPMGWNSWNKFHCEINEQLIRETADEMVATGMRDAGYVYLNLDDCWQGQRDAHGFIQPDPVKFPSGMKALVDYVHSKGLKFGIYSDAGAKTCAGYAGSRGYEYQDALQYAAWGVDYLKYDWCNTGELNAKEAYKTMRDALYAAKRPVLFSMCEWGSNKPWEWAGDVSHIWRTTGDIHNCFDCESPATYEHGVMQNFDKQKELRRYAGPGHWNDPDMLEVGNGMTVEEDRSHFTLWCMLAAPLIAGNDLTNMTKETKSILMNKDMIAVDQDALGVQGFMHRYDNGLEYWLKPLTGNRWAVVFLNRNIGEYKLTHNWADDKVIKDELSKTEIDFSNTFNIYNIWQGKNEGTTAKAYKATLAGHGVVALILEKK